ncbi:MAG: hypothetical protein R3C49_25500 [Planctomycetaceae bacterium]
MTEWLADHAIDSGIYRVTEVTKEEDLTCCYRVGLSIREKLRGDPLAADSDRSAAERKTMMNWGERLRGFG